MAESLTVLMHAGLSVVSLVQPAGVGIMHSLINKKIFRVISKLQAIFTPKSKIHSNKSVDLFVGAFSCRNGTFHPWC